MRISDCSSDVCSSDLSVGRFSSGRAGRAGRSGGVALPTSAIPALRQAVARSRARCALAAGSAVSRTATACCARAVMLERLGRREYLLDVALHLHLAPGAAHHALLVDQEGGAVDAHVLAPVERLLHPGAIGLADLAALVGGEGEGRS